MSEQLNPSPGITEVKFLSGDLLLLTPDSPFSQREPCFHRIGDQRITRPFDLKLLESICDGFMTLGGAIIRDIPPDEIQAYLRRVLEQNLRIHQLFHEKNNRPLFLVEAYGAFYRKEKNVARVYWKGLDLREWGEVDLSDEREESLQWGLFDKVDLKLKRIGIHIDIEDIFPVVELVDGKRKVRPYLFQSDSWTIV